MHRHGQSGTDKRTGDRRLQGQGRNREGVRRRQEHPGLQEAQRPIQTCNGRQDVRGVHRRHTRFRNQAEDEAQLQGKGCMDDRPHQEETEQNPVFEGEGRSKGCQRAVLHRLLFAESNPFGFVRRTCKGCRTDSKGCRHSLDLGI